MIFLDEMQSAHDVAPLPGDEVVGFLKLWDFLPNLWIFFVMGTLLSNHYGVGPRRRPLSTVSAFANPAWVGRGVAHCLQTLA
ncbi:hypothetical protein OKW30_005644 [Paraburkholderia sp. Clong3]|nr:hypothetical protein [Paraburkholderia sp. CI2]